MSNGKPKSKERIRIVVDEHEKRSKVPDMLTQLGVSVDFASLKVGDYVVSYDCCVERKSARDLLNSIYDGRIFLQLREMLKNYSHAVVIVEGSIEELEIDDPMVVYGALASLISDFKASVISTYSHMHTAYMLIALARRYLRDSNGKPVLLKKISKGNSLREQQISIVASLPGVGNRLALRLLDRFATPLNVFNAPLVELARVEGIGYARAARIKRVLECNTTSSNMRTTSLDNYTQDMLDAND
jgi:DNA excision repair protein ERCC-4